MLMIENFKAGESDPTFESNLLADHGSCLVVNAVSAYRAPQATNAHFNSSTCVCSTNQPEVILHTRYNCGNDIS